MLSKSRTSNPLEPFILRAYANAQNRSLIEENDTTLSEPAYQPVTASGLIFSAEKLTQYTKRAQQLSNLIVTISELSAPNLTLTEFSEIEPLQSGSMLVFNEPTSSAVKIPKTRDFNNELKHKVLEKFEPFLEIRDIFFAENENVITLTVVLALKFYDYDLMTRIFTSAEFPIIDNFLSEKIIDFKYLYLEKGTIVNSEGEHLLSR